VCGLKLKSVAARVFILNSRGKIRKRPLLTVAVQRAIDAFAKTYPAAFLDTDVAASLRLVASYYAATRQQAA
jgi:hypothetical protein